MATSLEKYVAFVPNTIEPYGYELVQILALPEGFRFRFRFDAEWVQEKVQNRLADLINHPGYILLRDFQSRRLYPIRHLTIVRALKVGQMYFFEYRLGALIEIDSDPTYRAQQLSGFRQEFASFHSEFASSNASEVHMKPLVFLSNFELNFENHHYMASTQEDRDSECWGNILACMAEIEFYEGVEFLRVLTVRPMSQNVGEASFSNGVVELRDKADYAIDIVQFIPHGGLPKHQPNDIRIRTDGKVLEVTKHEQRAVGKYDLLTFYFRAKALVRANKSFINIEHAVSAQGGDEQYIEPSVLLPASVAVSSRRFWLGIILAIAFTCTYLFPNILTSWLAADSALVKDVSIVGFSVSIVEILRELRKQFLVR